MIENGAIAAVVEPALPRDELEKDDQKLVQAVIHHDWVICELFRETLVLPLRFGTYFRGEEDLRSHLTFHGQNYHQKLAALAGKVELTLKLTPIPFSDTNPSPTEKGKAYLQAKKQRYQKQSHYERQQQAALEQFQTEITQTYPQLICGNPQENTERFYVLIDSAAFSDFSEKLKAWQQALPSWTIEVSDPLPPYHFL